MEKKGGVSWPMVILVSIIIVAIIIGVFVVFIIQTQKRTEAIFPEILANMRNFVVSLLGPLGTFLGS